MKYNIVQIDCDESGEPLTTCCYTSAIASKNCLANPTPNRHYVRFFCPFIPPGSDAPKGRPRVSDWTAAAPFLRYKA